MISDTASGHGFVFLCCLTAFGLLLAAMGRHQADWFGAKLPHRLTLTLRGAGFTMLFVAWLIAGLVLGFGYGTIVWCGWMTIAALILIAANINRDILLKWVKRR
ncbi:MAG: DUF3325 domain-containing protein [Asticcacaulis sp.]|uniref:DUF3325 domain-containing protein n=1 Tax=Asticcacaulis sp. TaxID=1872648 RepID=UPI0039E5C961